MTILKTIQEELEQHSGKKLKLKINDNRSTMLSVRWEPDYTKVSLHRMFLQAPRNVMDSLACYIKQEQKAIGPDVKAFIEKHIPKLDYSNQLDRSKLSVQGKIYDLEKIYRGLNAQYFKGNLNLSITWYGNAKRRNRTRVTFGLYHDPLKLIKINRLLDNPSFPDYIVAFVIYHEMLHHVCPPYIDAKGMNRIHGKEFKMREEQFEHYERAQKWIKENQKCFFSIK